MKTLYKTMLLTTAAVCLAAGGALAEGYQQNSATDSQSYNTSPSTTDGDQQTNMESGAMNDDGMDRSADAEAEADADANTDTQQTAGLSNEQIQDAQESLRNEGHSVSVDGIWGPQTAQAVRQFQQENGLDVTGSLDSETLAALDVDANAGASTNMNTETDADTGSTSGSTYPASE